MEPYEEWFLEMIRSFTSFFNKAEVSLLSMTPDSTSKFNSMCSSNETRFLQCISQCSKNITMNSPKHTTVSALGRSIGLPRASATWSTSFRTSGSRCSMLVARNTPPAKQLSALRTEVSLADIPTVLFNHTMRAIGESPDMRVTHNIETRATTLANQTSIIESSRTVQQSKNQCPIFYRNLRYCISTVFRIEWMFMKT